MLLTKFFKDKEIFITGGSGFIGKALIEKLLRSCPDLKTIYVLIRAKKGKTAQERLGDMLSTSLYNRLRQEQPHTLRKVIAIEGDCAALGLGISLTDLARLRNVSIIYHSAASVRFDDPLREAILLNTRGTHELVKLALHLQQLQAFVHVSTTYCNPHNVVVEERVYESYADWRTTVRLAETYSAETLNVFNLKYSGNQPNTYTFTKSLAEQVINDYKHQLPMQIFRPSIVISSLEEPVPGWADNFNGPTGMLVACGIGILRTNCADPDIVSDFVPVDIVVRAMIIAGYKRCMHTAARAQLASNADEVQHVEEVEVINCATASICPITTGEVIEIGKKYIKENPFEKTLWVPGGSITRCPVWHFIRFVTLQLLLAVIIDTALRLAKEKPFLLKLQRRIFAANMALHYFVTTSWDFKNDNFTALQECIPKSEIDKFSFMQHSNIDYVDFFRKGIRGAKEFLLNEPAESSQGARYRVKVFQLLHFLLQLVGVLWFVRVAVRYIYRHYYL